MRSRERVVDEMLVLAAQARCSEAFEQLAERWHPRLLRHARRLTGDAEGAREAVQEAWVGIARGLRGLGDPASFAPWALQITSRRCADWISKRQLSRPRSVNLEAARGAPAPGGMGSEDIARVRDAFRRLDTDRRALLTLYYIEGLSVAEIAAALAIPAGTVKSRLAAARDRLRAALEV
jgi:RNA polymerase sigma-70 factor (ECF subfamily)